MIVGTAGHIDHGKTSLIKALTGTDTDRLKEEKARGITIELGFAYLARPSGVMGFVDVPGHERFVHTMLAGAHGIDFVLLVIAADDGVMPQTREHLEILDLLGLSHGCVVLSKADLVDADTLLLRELGYGALAAARGDEGDWAAMLERFDRLGTALARYLLADRRGDVMGTRILLRQRLARIDGIL